MIDGIVTRVTSGDTIHLITPVKRRLCAQPYGIDAPEIDTLHEPNGESRNEEQPYAQESLKTLEDKVLAQKVYLGDIDMNKQKRFVGIIFPGRPNINMEMARDGHAEVFPEGSRQPYRSKFLNAEREALSVKREIWSLPVYERPLVFRKRMNIRDGEQAGRLPDLAGLPGNG